MGESPSDPASPMTVALMQMGAPSRKPSAKLGDISYHQDQSVGITVYAIDAKGRALRRCVYIERRSQTDYYMASGSDTHHRSAHRQQPHRPPLMVFTQERFVYRKFFDFFSPLYRSAATWKGRGEVSSFLTSPNLLDSRLRGRGEADLLLVSRGEGVF